MVRLLLLCVFVGFLACQSDPRADLSQFSVIPKPLSDQALKGGFTFSEDFVLVSEDSLLRPAAALVKSYLDSLLPWSVSISNGSGQTGSLYLSIDSQLNLEEYRLEILEKGIHIQGGSPQAVLLGFQSLRQMILALPVGAYTIPCRTISDQPRFPWRSMMLDCSRHFMDKDFVKRYIDLLALHKMNVFHWHLTEDQGWRIEIKKYPKLTEIGAYRKQADGSIYGGFYTQEEVKEVVAYAAERGITVIPEIEMPGHALAALAAYSQFSCTGGPFEVTHEWGVFKEVYCAGNEDTYQFLEDILAEVIPLFPAPYLHIGGDEVPKFRWENCPKCQETIKKEGLKDEHELQSHFLTRIEKYLNAHGKRMIGWDEILEGGLAPNAIVQSWRGFEGAAQAAKEGHQAIVSPTSHAYFDYGLHDINLQKVYDFEPVPQGLTVEQAKFIIGGSCNMWSERAPQYLVDSKVFPRILAMAEVLWSDSAGRDFNEFRARVNHHYTILDKLGVKYGFEATPVTFSTELKDGQIYFVIHSYDSLQEVFYRSNNQPEIKYTQPIAIKGTEDYQIGFARNGQRYAEQFTQKIESHKAVGKSLDLDSAYSPSYTAGGNLALLDGKRGSNQFRDGNWQGYWESNVLATLDLGSEQEITKLSSGYLQYSNAWIFFPVKVEYLYSSDGVEFIKAGEVLNQENPENKSELTQEYQLEIKPIKARFIKVIAHSLMKCPAWHDGAGSGCWLFVDEIVVSH